MNQLGVPLPAEEVEDVVVGALWRDFEWGPTSLRLNGKEYKVLRLHYMPHAKPQPAEGA